MNFLAISKFLLYVAPFAIVVVTPSTLFPFIVGKYTFFKLVIELSLAAFMLGWGFSKEHQKYRVNYHLLKRPLVIAVAFFVVIFALAGFTGIDPWASFWSNFERGEGVFLMLHLFVFFLLLILLFTKENDWKNLFRTVIASGVVVMLYGIAGALKLPGFVGVPFCDRFAGSLGNPAYIGTVSIFLLFYVAYLLVSGNWRSKNWQQWSLPFLVFLGLYFIFFLMLSQTRGGFLGLGVSAIMTFAYLAFTFPPGSMRRAAIGGAVILVLLGSLGVYYRQYVNLAPWCGEGANRILDVSLSGATIGTRFELWKTAIEAWKDRPILGWGPENFSIAFERHFNPVHEVWFDRAHNIFFDYLVFGGILGLLSFIGMFAAFYLQFFAVKRVEPREKLSQNDYQAKLQEALLFSLLFGYLVQGLVLFDVLPIYINLFLVLAFAVWRFDISRKIA